MLVTVRHTRGSVPRGSDAWMAVFADHTVGTVGGGHLEWKAIRHARALLPALADDARFREPIVQRVALGPTLGQCCGGEVHLGFELVMQADASALAVRLAPVRHPVALFGGGHVGEAIVRVCAALPLQVTWIDSRDEVFPAQVPDNTTCEHSSPVQDAVPSLAGGSGVLIMSFSHAEDLDVVSACLQRMRGLDDLPYVGLIGSATKWAAFQARLRERGFADAELARITCPIGIPGVRGKAPDVIAVSVAAQLLQRLGL